ncbi:lipid A deacylase LpxR family protein [Vibrio hippocampi]|uniref:Lipid A deacylase LpxR family protein n=1 Tax=Vibrio hippocampi TaxID=654686 RepID=A0ABM8ZIG8_9VIBR|nr:lipid A deacylase LpxR family protein [Vibrio hippocampi]CAH0526453.1 hypothetical protein VHP8226_01813 [Vibrio hippocampi]
MQRIVKYRTAFITTLFTSLAILGATPSHAKSAISINMDNDWVTGTDEDYTNGFAIRYGQNIDNDHPIRSALPHRFWSEPNSHALKWGVEIGQKMWTPKTLGAATTLKNERPYAGLLYVDFSLTESTPKIAHSYSMLFGTTGERSYAENTQIHFHKLFDSVNSKGWDTQIEDKWVFAFSYKGDYKLYRSEQATRTAQHEISNSSRIVAGNYRSELASGILWRWGNDLSNSFGSASINNEMPFDARMLNGNSSGLFLFSGLEARVRFNDITIDGDRPKDLPAVTLETWQATVVVGIAKYNQSWGGSFSFAVKTNDYQQSQDSFAANASMAIFYRF